MKIDVKPKVKLSTEFNPQVVEWLSGLYQDAIDGKEEAVQNKIIDDDHWVEIVAHEGGGAISDKATAVTALLKYLPIHVARCEFIDWDDMEGLDIALIARSEREIGYKITCLAWAPHHEQYVWIAYMVDVTGTIISLQEMYHRLYDPEISDFIDAGGKVPKDLMKIATRLVRKAEKANAKNISTALCEALDGVSRN